MKPGPLPSCDCDKCRKCQMRRYRRAHYRRNPLAISAEKAEYKRRRKQRLATEPSDAELDRRAAEWLSQRNTERVTLEAYGNTDGNNQSRAHAARLRLHANAAAHVVAHLLGLYRRQAPGKQRHRRCRAGAPNAGAARAGHAQSARFGNQAGNRCGPSAS